MLSFNFVFFAGFAVFGALAVFAARIGTSEGAFALFDDSVASLVGVF